MCRTQHSLTLAPRARELSTSSGHEEAVVTAQDQQLTPIVNWAGRNVRHPNIIPVLVIPVEIRTLGVSEFDATPSWPARRWPGCSLEMANYLRSTGMEEVVR